MTAKFVSERNLKFLLYDVFDAVGLTQYDYFGQHNKKMFDMVLDATLRLAKDLCLPLLSEMDQQPFEFTSGEVRVHEAVRKFMKECGDGGWIAASFPAEHEGEQLPHLVSGLCSYIFGAANYSLSVYPMLNAGSARLITSFGDKELIDTYVPHMLSGRWQGTMALTEPQAGSSLSDITTEAIPDDGGFYRIHGQKTFISAGDHNGVENVVHLLLAKIPGGPPGVKGISLFVVPKHRRDENGGLIANDVAVSQVYHKLGYRGCPITELVFGQKDNCRGDLVGEAHKGLSYMFQMMNSARIEVGLGAAAIAQAAYFAALDYARQRPQGRPVGQRDARQPQVPIIEHADVKRMLLFQRAIVEGALSLILQCARYEDLHQVTSGEGKEKYGLLLDLLTPVAKTYPSEYGQLAVSSSLQCFGGYGYCQDFPVEQYFRDIRIHPIHEGTTGIQGMDLLGRKVVMHDGRAAELLFKEVHAAIAACRDVDVLAGLARQLTEAMDLLQKVTAHLVGQALSKGAEVFLADATLYLEMFGIITIAWQWLLQAISAHRLNQKARTAADRTFYEGKLHTCRFFFAYELPKIKGLAETLTNEAALTVEMEPGLFRD